MMLTGIRSIVFDMGGTLELGGQWYPDAIPTLKRLQPKHRLFILANQGASARIFLQQSGVIKLFEGVYLSGEARLLKPELDFLKKLLLEQQINPATTLMVGDDLENDIAPAQALGLKSAWIKRGPGYHFATMSGVRSQISPDFELNSLDELVQ